MHTATTWMLTTIYWFNHSFIPPPPECLKPFIDTTIHLSRHPLIAYNQFYHSLLLPPPECLQPYIDSTIHLSQHHLNAYNQILIRPFIHPATIWMLTNIYWVNHFTHPTTAWMLTTIYSYNHSFFPPPPEYIQPFIHITIHCSHHHLNTYNHFMIQPFIHPASTWMLTTDYWFNQSACDGCASPSVNLHFVGPKCCGFIAYVGHLRQ